MNIREIQDRLIGAETVMRELSEGRVGPAPLRAQQLPYVHSEADMRNWGHRRGDRRSADPKADACRLRKEDDEAYSIFRQEFWDIDTGPSPEEVSLAHQVKGWVMLVDDDGERRALQAWVLAMAGGRKFARWCRNIEHIAVMTGRRRKNRAVDRILAQLSSKSHLHDGNGPEGVLPVTPDLEHVSATLADGMTGRETSLNSWASDEAFQPITYARLPGTAQVDVEGDFSWAAKRNARRRQQEARRKAAA